MFYYLLGMDTDWQMLFLLDSNGRVYSQIRLNSSPLLLDRSMMMGIGHTLIAGCTEDEKREVR